MTKILHFSEKVGCGVTFRLDSGEPCLLSVAQTGVRVKKSRLGFLGAILYHEKNAYQAAKTGMALDSLFPEQKIPLPITNPVLRAFANAIWHCASAAEVARTLNEAGGNAGDG
jgi:hypothetical protein